MSHKRLNKTSLDFFLEALLKKYTVLVWCEECTGEDYEGCFDGSTMTLGPFNSEKEAEEAAEKYIKSSIWKYEIQTRQENLPD